MNTTYQIHFVGLGVFYADSSEAVQALASLCRDEKVKGFVLQMLAKGFIKDKALNNLDFLFSEHKKDFHFSSDVFCNRFRDVLNWGLKHLIGYAVTVPVEEHFETSCVECYSKEDNYKDALDLLGYWRKERLKVEADEADAESQSFVPVVEDVPAVAKSNNVSSIAGETKIKEEALNDLTAFFKGDSIKRDEFLETCINVSSFRVLESYLNCVGYKFANELVHGNIRGSVYTLKRLYKILFTLGVVNNTLKSFRADYKKLKNNEE